MQKYQLHDSAARRAEVVHKAMISGTEGKSCQWSGEGGAQCEAPIESQRIVMFVRENAYQTVVSQNSDRLPINRMPTLHPHIGSAANAKSPQRSDRGQKSLVGSHLCEAPSKKDQRCPWIAPQAPSRREPSFSCFSSSHDCGPIPRVFPIPR